MLEDSVSFILLIIVILSLRSEPSTRNALTALLGATAVWLVRPRTSYWSGLVLSLLLILASILSPLQLLLFRSDAKSDSKDPINILHNPIDVDSDVVAIHGLGSSVETTWKHGRTGNLWLKDNLPLHLPKSRIMTYRHNSNWISSAQAKDLRDFGKQLLSGLINARETEETRNRPLILIGHSFGGLLIEQALVIAKESLADKYIEKQQTHLVDSLCGIIFLGTPHAGSSYTTIGKLLCHLTYWQGSSTMLLRSVDPESDSTWKLEDAFWSGYSDLPTIDFSETKLNRIFGFPINLVVKKHASAQPGRSWKTLDTDHFGLNKYADEEDASYIVVKSEIKRMILNKIQVKDENLDRERAKYHELWSWLQPYSFESVQRACQHQYIEGTCQWIKQEEQYQVWGRKENVLWLFGKPGSGKTFIAYHILEYLKQKQEINMHFFFDAKSATRKLRSLERFYPTILYQLFYEIPLSDRHLRAQCFRVVQDKWLMGRLSRDTFKDSLRQILAKIGRPIYLIIDALDECNENSDDPEELKEWLAQEYLHPNLRILITSRPEQIIRDFSDSSLFMNLDLASLVEKSNEDIRVLIRNRLVASKKFKRSEPEWEAVKKGIESKLMEKADGMILYAKLMLDLLERKAGNAKDLMMELDRLPQDIVSIYVLRLKRVNDIEFASTIFKWLATSRRSLTVSGLLGVYTVVKEMKDRKDDDLRRQDLQHRMDQDRFRIALEEECFPLIEILKDETVRLVHTSVSQFLLGQYIEGLSGTSRSKARRAPPEFCFKTEECHAQLAFTCLTYLRLVIDAEGCNGISKNMDLRSYAVTEWSSHSQECEKLWESHSLSKRDISIHMVDLLVNFCAERSLFEAWLRERVERDARFAVQFSLQKSTKRRLPTPLHIAAYFSLWRVGCKFCMDAKTEDATGSTPLHIATEQGHLPTIRGLLNAGAKVEMQDHTGSTALHRAAHGGNMTALRELLHFGAAGLNTADKYHFTALHIVCHTGTIEGVEMLLQHRVLIDDKGSQAVVESPLDVAVANGHSGVVRTILQHRPELIKSCGKPLIQAARKGKTDMVMFLCEQGADLSYIDLHGQTVLHKACISGNTTLVRFLLSDLKVFVDPNDNSKRTPLYFAAEKGYLEIVNLLIDHHANLNSLDRRNETPLFKPAGRGHTDVVQRLLEAGTDAMILDDWKRSPLHFAAMYGRVDIVRTLLKETNIDQNLPNWLGRTTLHTAAASIRQGQEEVIDILFSYGAKSAQLGMGKETALHAAILRVPGEPPPTKSLIEKLIQGGVPLDSEDQHRRTSLFAAIQTHNIEAVDLLLQHGASPNKNSLHIAVMTGNIFIVRSLLKFKSKLSTSERNWRGETALHAAAREGYDSIVRELLQAGISTSSLDMDNMTALTRAEQKGFSRIVALLKDSGSMPIEADRDKEEYRLWVGRLLHQAPAGGSIIEESPPDTMICYRDEVGRTALHLAVYSKNLEALKYLISAGADTELRDELGRTPLHYAAQAEEVDILETLIHAGSDLNVQDIWLLNPLHLAVKIGDLNTTRRLISAGSKIACNNQHQNALHIAAYNGREDIFAALIDMDISEATIFQKQCWGETPLHLASKNGHTDIVRALLRQRRLSSNVDAQDKNGLTALHLAAWHGHQPIVRNLLDAGAIVFRTNKNRDMAVHFAAEAGFFEIVQELMQAIPDHVERSLKRWDMSMPNWPVSEFEEAYDPAFTEALSDAEAIIYDEGLGGWRIEPSKWIPEQRNALKSSVVSMLQIWDNTIFSIPSTALMRAVKGRSVQLVEFLLNKFPHMPLHTLSYHQHNVLSLACSLGLRDAASLLIRAGSKVNAISDRQDTALLASAENGHTDVVELLLENGANADLARLQDGYTPLHLAAEKNHVDAARVLVRTAFVNALDDLGQTPLHLACYHGNEAVVHALLDADADVLIQDSRKQTPLSVASDLDHAAILKLLQSEAMNRS